MPRESLSARQSSRTMFPLIPKPADYLSLRWTSLNNPDFKDGLSNKTTLIRGPKTLSQAGRKLAVLPLASMKPIATFRMLGDAVFRLPECRTFSNGPNQLNEDLIALTRCVPDPWPISTICRINSILQDTVPVPASKTFLKKPTGLSSNRLCKL